jgi:hypothetical protein
LKPNWDSKPHWITRQRLTAYPRLLVAVLLVVGVVWLRTIHHLVDSQHQPLGADFLEYWTVSKMALAGHAADAYNLQRIVSAEHAALPASTQDYAWFYPPTFYLLVLPLSLMPYLAALIVFLGSTLAAYVAVIWRVVRDWRAMWCLAAFTGLWSNLLQGQNGFLTAAIAGAALLCMVESPALAGVFVGLLAIKPHLALLFPVALIAGRMWKTMAVAAATTAIFLVTGVVVLGPATLKATIGGLPTARLMLENGAAPWAAMPTVFAMLRMMHAPVALAYAMHAVVAFAAIAAVWRVWSRCSDWALRGAALMTATFLVSPYILSYDMTWLAFPIAWMAAVGMRDGWLRGEREMLVAVWLLPGLMGAMVSLFHVQPAVLVLIALLGMVLRRAELAAKTEWESEREVLPEPALAQAW